MTRQSHEYHDGDKPLSHCRALPDGRWHRCCCVRSEQRDCGCRARSSEMHKNQDHLPDSARCLPKCLVRQQFLLDSGPEIRELTRAKRGSAAKKDSKVQRSAGWRISWIPIFLVGTPSPGKKKIKITN